MSINYTFQILWCLLTLRLKPWPNSDVRAKSVWSHCPMSHKNTSSGLAGSFLSSLSRTDRNDPASPLDVFLCDIGQCDHTDFALTSEFGQGFNRRVKRHHRIWNV